MIPDEAMDAAHRAWREQAALDGSIFEYNLRAALEAAAPHMLAEAVDDVPNQILAANITEGFTGLSAGLVAALKNLADRIPE